MKNYIYILITFIIFSSCDKKTTPKVITGNALGTTYSIQFFSTKKFPVQQKIDSVFEVVNASMSTYIPNSDISKINKGEQDIRVDDMFKEVFSLSKKIHKESNGFFDPTVGNLVNFYGFGADKFNLEKSTEKLDSLMQFVGFDKVKLNHDGRIIKEDPRIYIEFNAIGKGYAVDRISAMLNANNINNYLVEVGGELNTRGKDLQADKNWYVGIDDPLQNEKRDLVKIISLKNRAMATSGNYRKYRIDSVTGQKYVHTINPKNGLSKKSDLLSASVLAKTCAEADAYATAFMAMGFQKSKQLAKQLPEIDVFFIYDEKGSLKSFSTPGFDKVIVKK
ncbi:FAD:protein FMN transferase [Mesonia aquimarina]|uniref:FAD:protein FMN transferase n=1 Tax=Mesonia aquimarina TaxID=1504967 RepID=UPI000EF60C71|nr:FAD:protein FMN transferase [Mesonia aquimarina]